MGTIEKLFTALGTVNHVKAVFEKAERDTVRQALDRVEEYICGMDDLLSVFKPDSEISLINRNAGVAPTGVSEETFRLLSLCVEYGDRTSGVFDITTRPLADSSGQMVRVDYRDIILDGKALTVMLRHKGQAIHLGGIAKGYLIDRAAGMLRESGVRKATLDFGGTVRAVGLRQKVGIRNPFDRERVAAALETGDEAVVTSGLYERGNHIFNPATGRPAETDLASVTVIGPDGAAADAAATACMVLGAERSFGLLDSLGMEGIMIRKNGEMFATKGIKDKIEVY